MKHPFSLTLSLAALLAAGCSSTPTQVDNGPMHAASFSFRAVGPRPQFSVADAQEPIHALIQDSIKRNLAGKGLTNVPSGGDVIVAYLVIIGNRVSYQTISTYFGYGRGATALGEKAHDAYLNSRNPNYYEAGTLVIDVIDGKTFELLNRSHVTRALLNHPPAEVQKENVQEAVDAALVDLKIAP